MISICGGQQQVGSQTVRVNFLKGPRRGEREVMKNKAATRLLWTALTSSMQRISAWASFFRWQPGLPTAKVIHIWDWGDLKVLDLLCRHFVFSHSVQPWKNLVCLVSPKSP